MEEGASMKVNGNVLAGSVAGLLALASWPASALEPDADLSNVPGRGIDIVAGILDGTLDFGEAVLFARGGLYGDEGLFEDYLRDFLLGPTGKEGILAEHGFGGAMIGGYGVAANALAPHGYLVSTALWVVGGNPDEVTNNHAPGPLTPSGGLLGMFPGPSALASSAPASNLGGSTGLSVVPSGLLDGGGITGLGAIPVSLVGGLPGN